MSYQLELEPRTIEVECLECGYSKKFTSSSIPVIQLMVSMEQIVCNNCGAKCKSLGIYTDLTMNEQEIIEIVEEGYGKIIGYGDLGFIPVEGC